MKRYISVLLLLMFMLVTPVHADWRWSKPHFKTQLVAYSCEDSGSCFNAAVDRAHLKLRNKINHYNTNRLKQWKHWTSIYIPSCTWYGESGEGPEYARYRYTIYNSQGSGARGKFQFMPGTYAANAKYFDWSPLDQEIAVRREFWKHGSSPWSNC